MAKNEGCFAKDFSGKLLQLDTSFSRWLGTSAFRPEARLIMLLANFGPISVKEAMYGSSLSHRSFYLILDRLKEAGVVEVRNDAADARVRHIYVSEQHMMECNRIYECFKEG